MGLRCLIGHDFSERQTERERQERGREVVVTVREYRECTRCGNRRIISENKEVTAEAAPEEDEDDTDQVDEMDVGAEIDEEMSAAEDDGIILDDEPEEPRARERGEWPDSAAEIREYEGEPSAWPEVAGEDEGFDAEPDDGTPADDIDFKGGLTPERTPDPEQALEEIDTEPYDQHPPDGDGDDDGQSGTDDDSDDSPLGISKAGPSPTPTGQQRMADIESEFVCPECDYTTAGVGTSLRPGDICPECRRGYLTEQER